MLEPEHSDTSMPAMVWLVGAGPGDPGLLTLRGRRCLEEAAVIVYDALVNPLILEWARPEAERICAGKRAGDHSLEQSMINALLADCAESGRPVCRLKGGDPFIFGRGGEEALYLRERGIPFEVVPGVTSAVAGPAYAGIPVTHRGISSDLRIVTGHETPEKEEALVDWEGLSQATQSTLVFLMAKLNLDGIAARLMRGAWPGETPAAVIAQASLPSQETVLAPLCDIAEAARHLPRPALLVVGEAVRFRETLAWYERKPLFGRRIVVTRARRESVALAEKLIDLGAEAILAPMLEIVPPRDPNAFDTEVAGIAEIDWIVFTSVAGVGFFFNALDRLGWDSRTLISCLVAAVGPATASALEAHGIRPDLVPDRYETAALLDIFCTRERIKGKRFLLPRSALASPDLAEGLRRAGAHVREAEAYDVLSGPPLDVTLLDRFEQGAIDLVLFSSPSTVRHFIDAIPPDRRKPILANLNAAAIGPVTAKALKSLDITPRLIAETFTGPGLIDAVCRYFTENPGLQEH